MAAQREKAALSKVLMAACSNGKPPRPFRHPTDQARPVQQTTEHSRLSVVVVRVEVNVLQVDLHKVTNDLLHGGRVLVEQAVDGAASRVGGVRGVCEVQHADVGLGVGLQIVAIPAAQLQQLSGGNVTWPVWRHRVVQQFFKGQSRGFCKALAQ